MARAYRPGSYGAASERRGQDYPYPWIRWTENPNLKESLKLVAHGDVSLKEGAEPQRAISIRLLESARTGHR